MANHYIGKDFLNDLLCILFLKYNTLLNINYDLGGCEKWELNINKKLEKNKVFAPNFLMKKELDLSLLKIGTPRRPLKDVKSRASAKIL